MAMDKINGSPLLQSGILDRFNGNKAEKNKPTEHTGVSAPPGPTSDKAEISDTAHKLIDLRQAVDTGRDALDQLPEVREDKIALAKQRLTEGYYQSSEVQQQVAEKLGSVFAAIDEI